MMSTSYRLISLLLLLSLLPGLSLAKRFITSTPVTSNNSAKTNSSNATVTTPSTTAPMSSDSAITSLSVDQLAIAKTIYTGVLPCQLGSAISITPAAKAEGYFELTVAKKSYRIAPIITSTGVTRLEDPKSGIVLIQQSVKTMVMNEHLGQRLADDCKSAEQVQASREAMGG